MITGKRIRQLRLGRKLSQKQLAEKLGVSRQAVNGWENDKGLPYWTNLGQLADLFGVSIKYLLYGDNGPQRPASKQSEPKAGQDTGEPV